MKFAKVLEQALVEDGIPAEWVEAAIQYKLLKKCISQVVTELEFLGLKQNTLKLILEDKHNDRIVEVDQEDTNPSNPVLAEYTLTKSSSSRTIVPTLKITLDFSGEYTDDYILQVGLDLKKNIELVLNTDDAGEKQRAGDAISQMIRLEREEGKLRVISPTSSHRQEHSDPDSCSALSSCLERKKSEIFILLNSDSRFFQMLNEELEKLDLLKQRERQNLTDQVQHISTTILKLSTASTGILKTSDLYRWRALFKIYLDSQIYFKYNETSISASERNSEQVRKNLETFLSNVDKSGILHKLKHKQSLVAFNQFVNTNYHLLKVLEFQTINSEAFRKILKKFDKQTLLGIKLQFRQLVSNDHIFITGSSIAQDICYIMQTSLLSLVPQLEDYTCLICTSVAFKPIRLLCGHMFCVRCLVKLKQQQRNNCPVCRKQDAILNADGSNLDVEAMAIMKRYFPVEVKNKLRERDQEKYSEIRHDPGKCCIV